MLDKIIFLDIDGVLNVYCEGRDQFGCTFHKHLEDNLREIIEKTQAKIVISSSWRLDGFETMKQMWIHRNLPGEVIDITPNLFMIPGVPEEEYLNNDRGHEIKRWLKDNPTKNYVILDDDIDFLPDQMDNFVRCSENQDHEDCVDGGGYGLTKKCAEKAIYILNKSFD